MIDERNIIKSNKLIHVHQDFYQVILNGFGESKVQQSKSVTIPANQKTFIQKRSLPNVLKYVQNSKILQKFYNGIIFGKRQDFLSKIRNGFADIWFGGKNEQDQDENEVSQVEQRQALFTFDKLNKAAKNYRRIKFLIGMGVRIKNFFNDDDGQLHITYEQYTNKVILDKKLATFYAQMSIRSENMRPIIEAILGSTILQLKVKLNEKVQKVVSAFWWWMVKNILLPDWQDPIDVLCWALSVVGTVLSFGSGAGLAFAGRMVKVAKWVERISSAIKKMKGLSGLKNFAKYMSKGGRLMKKGGVKLGRLSKDGKKLGSKIIGYRNRVLGDKWYKRLGKKIAYKSIKGVDTVIDVLSISDQQAAQMRSDITNATSKWGTAINETLNSAAQGVTVTILDAKETQKFLGQVASDIAKTTVLLNNDNLQRKYLQMYQQKNGKVKVLGSQKITTFGLLGNINQKLIKIKQTLQKTVPEIANKKVEQMFGESYEFTMSNIGSLKFNGKDIRKVFVQLKDGGLNVSIQTVRGKNLLKINKFQEFNICYSSTGRRMTSMGIKIKDTSHPYKKYDKGYFVFNFSNVYIGQTLDIKNPKRFSLMSRMNPNRAKIDDYTYGGKMSFLRKNVQGKGYIHDTKIRYQMGLPTGIDMKFYVPYYYVVESGNGGNKLYAKSVNNVYDMFDGDGNFKLIVTRNNKWNYNLVSNSNNSRESLGNYSNLGKLWDADEQEFKKDQFKKRVESNVYVQDYEKKFKNKDGKQFNGCGYLFLDINFNFGDLWVDATDMRAENKIHSTNSVLMNSLTYILSCKSRQLIGQKVSTAYCYILDKFLNEELIKPHKITL